MVNLIGNAIKFTPTGDVTVTVVSIDPTSASIKPGTSTEIILRVEVADTGIGISLDRIEEIFEAYTQAARSTTRRFGGSGLGLAICRRLIELMGGKIGAKPGERGGTVFWLEIPVEPVESSLEPKTASLEGRRVYVFAPNHAETGAMLNSLCDWHILATHFDSKDALLNAVRDKTWASKNCQLVLVDADLQSEWHRLIADPRFKTLTNKSVTWIGMPDAATKSTRYLDRPVHASALFNELVAIFASHVVPVETRRAPQEDAIGESQLVLIVDDNEVNRLVASEMMKRLGFEAIAVESGQAAVEAVEQQAISFILMDCEMSGMDGLEATARIRDLHYQNRLCLPASEPLGIVACTAQATASDRQRCLEAGMDDYITKPIRREDLVAAMKNVMRREPPIHLEELLHRCGDDRSVAAEVLQTFATRGPEDVRRIALAAIENADETSAAAHRIKGAAATLAAHELTRIAEAIEETSRAGKPHRKQNYLRSLQELDQEMPRCVRWIETTLESLQ